ncbi:MULTISPECIES: hypothetical protein [unclassified Akkermansia]|nr:MULTISPECIES: hypothetical protein [unclassified Akkermansia]KAA3165136.1 hypothetical protein F2A01_01170 [Akkermansia sp. BIOML-A60]KAA3173724.1 hypothetical protein F2A07_03940 [Akkermansia sp. BIOML-A61]KAA3195914.1 hypothetical protein F2A21_03460 [Akkermansia sp. BIOML-A54]KAA3226570.1 hypothetical protein F1985_01805 [Akkermansia sp. BIOML-A41]KAA3150353.1 hypothetical protein F2A16_02135 [Akkermansia sp. BIOML-A67]
MSERQLQIQFPRPGVWEEFTMTAVYRDAEGYIRTDRYTQDEIPADQAPAMAAVVAALVGLAEPWQASQVWAHLMTATIYSEDDPYTPTGQRDEVALDVEAVNPQGGRRVFTSRDYPVFVITDSASVAFFKHFTKQP